MKFSPDGQFIFAAGSSTVNGCAQSVVKLDAATGAVDLSVQPERQQPRGSDLDLSNGRGHRRRLPLVSGHLRERLAMLDPATGAPWRRSFNLPVTESRDEFGPYVIELERPLTAVGSLLAATSVDVAGKRGTRWRVIDLGGATAAVADWSTGRLTSTVRNVYDDTWIRGIDISPDSKYFVGQHDRRFLRQPSLCDTATRWELPPIMSGGGLQPTWINHSGGDTHWAARSPMPLSTSAATSVGRTTLTPALAAITMARGRLASRHRRRRPLHRCPALVESDQRPWSGRRGVCRHPTTTCSSATTPRWSSTVSSASASPSCRRQRRVPCQPGPGEDQSAHRLAPQHRRQPLQHDLRRHNLRPAHAGQRTWHGRRRLNAGSGRLRPERQPDYYGRAGLLPSLDQRQCTFGRGDQPVHVGRLCRRRLRPHPLRPALRRGRDARRRRKQGRIYYTKSNDSTPVLALVLDRERHHRQTGISVLRGQLLERPHHGGGRQLALRVDERWRLTAPRSSARGHRPHHGTLVDDGASGIHWSNVHAMFATQAPGGPMSSPSPVLSTATTRASPGRPSTTPT